MCVPIDIVSAILGQHYEEITEFDALQTNTMQTYFKRNQRLSLNLKKNKENIVVVPK